MRKLPASPCPVDPTTTAAKCTLCQPAPGAHDRVAEPPAASPAPEAVDDNRERNARSNVHCRGCHRKAGSVAWAEACDVGACMREGARPLVSLFVKPVGSISLEPGDAVDVFGLSDSGSRGLRVRARHLVRLHGSDLVERVGEVGGVAGFRIDGVEPVVDSLGRVDVRRNGEIVRTCAATLSVAS